jgi:hypothetical protein
MPRLTLTHMKNAIGSPDGVSPNDQLPNTKYQLPFHFTFNVNVWLCVRFPEVAVTVKV